jgi:hypothetical protein
MKNFVLLPIVFSLVCFSTYAQAPSKKQKPSECPKKILDNPIQLFETYDNQGVNLGFRGDLLYMIYSVPTLTFASRESLIGTNLHSVIVGVPGRLSLGLDCALTYTMPNSPGYSFEAGWYHIVAQFRRNQVASDLEPAHIVSVTGTAPGTGMNRGHVAINFFDLLFSKDYSLGSFFFLSPGAGVIGGYINSESTSQFNATSGTFGTVGGSAIRFAQASKFEGLGVKLKTGYKFSIWKGLKLTGNLSYNMLYGFSKTTIDFTSNGAFPILGGTASGTTVLAEEHTGRTLIDSLISLAWQQAFSNNSMFFDVHAGWRYQAYQAGYFAAEAETDDSIQSNWLFGQGLEAGVAFKF